MFSQLYVSACTFLYPWPFKNCTVECHFVPWCHLVSLTTLTVSDFFKILLLQFKCYCLWAWIIHALKVQQKCMIAFGYLSIKFHEKKMIFSSLVFLSKPNISEYFIIKEPQHTRCIHIRQSFGFSDSENFLKKRVQNVQRKGLNKELYDSPNFEVLSWLEITTSQVSFPIFWGKW